MTIIKAKVIGIGNETTFKGSYDDVKGNYISVTFNQEHGKGLDCGQAFCISAKLENVKIGNDCSITISYEKGKGRKIQLVQVI